jgi:dCMP deaminase
MNIAFEVATRATCDRAKVGSVIVRDKRILTTGYNGSPKGQPHCDDAGHLMIDGHCCRTLHSECNAIIQASIHGIAIPGSTCYVTHYPCFNCAKMLVNAGIIRVVYKFGYRIDYHTVDLFIKAGIEVVFIDEVQE